MSFFSYALGAVVLILVLLRQVRVVPVPRVYHPRLPIILGVIGLLELISYAGDHHVSSARLGLGARHAWWSAPSVWARCAASPCGCGRPTAGWSARATPSTMALWLVSLLVHFVGDAASTHSGGAGLEGASFLLYLGLTLGVQYYVVYRRALPLWAQLGPERRPAAAGALHPGTGCLLRHLPLGRRRPGRMGAHRRTCAGAATTPT